MIGKSIAELIGTFWMVLAGCGTAILAGHEVGLLGVSLAFGLSVIAMAYVIGPVSGCHLNPAISFGLWIAGRMPRQALLPYMAAQALGAVLAGGVLFVIATGKPEFSPFDVFAANGYGRHSPGGYSMGAALITEVLLTALFVFIVMGATERRVPAGFAPLAIGFALMLIHLISLPVTNTSVNPARSLGVALFAGPWALQQLWLFWLGPMLGGALGAVGYCTIGAPEPTAPR